MPETGRQLLPGNIRALYGDDAAATGVVQPSTLKDVQVGHYCLREQIGEGGMGKVYRADDLLLGRKVAIKCMRTTGGSQDESRRRMLHEARAASALNDAHICTIYDVVEKGADIFIVMEFIEGVTLREWVRKRREEIGRDAGVFLGEVVAVALHCAEGLRTAHRHGIVHRDVKPENVMVSGKDVVKIMDFGLATSSSMDSIVLSGTLQGTPAYMSPEQIRGETVDVRADIFSFATVLYEMLADRMPYSASHPAAVLYEILNADAPVLSSVIGPIAAPLDDLISRCLRKNPNERPNDLDAVIEGIQAFRAHLVEPSRSGYPAIRGTGSKPRSAGRRRALRWSGFVVALLSLVYLLVMQFESVPSARNVPANMQGVNATPGGGMTQEKEVGEKTPAPPPLLPPAATPDEMVQRIIQGLEDRVPAVGVRLEVTPFLLAGSRAGSTFSLYAKELLEDRIAEAGRWVVVEEGSPGALPTHVLTGSYRIRSDRVILSVKLIAASDRRMLASTEAQLARRALPEPESKLVPHNLESASANLKTFGEETANGDLTLSVRTNKGQENLVFARDEKMTLTVDVSAPAYIRVIYHLADGNRVLLMDSIRVGPDAVNRPFRLPKTLVCTPPFGMEILQVFARTEPFAALKVRDVDGYAFLERDVEEYAAQMRGMKKAPIGVLTVERRLVITTVERPTTVAPSPRRNLREVSRS